VISLTKFLKHINSFALTDLYLDDIKLGDRYLALISNEIAERYILFWDKKPNDLRSSMNPKNNASLEILQTISLSNVSVSE
jgi:hypothetical protein